MRILAVCGSLHAKSKNLALLKAAAASAPPGVRVVLFDGLRDLPLARRKRARRPGCRARGLLAGVAVLSDVLERQQPYVVSQNRSQHVPRLAQPHAAVRRRRIDEEQHSGSTLTTDPETLMLHADNVALIEHSMRDLPDRFRELLVLRELEGLSYQGLAIVLGIPIGSVMSGLSCARRAFRRALETGLKRTDCDPDEAVVL